MPGENNIEKTFKKQAYTKKQLKELYKVSYETLYEWLVVRRKLFTHEYYVSISLFTPKEIEDIITAIGEP